MHLSRVFHLQASLTVFVLICAVGCAETVLQLGDEDLDYSRVSRYAGFAPDRYALSDLTVELESISTEGDTVLWRVGGDEWLRVNLVGMKLSSSASWGSSRQIVSSHGGTEVVVSHFEAIVWQTKTDEPAQNVMLTFIGYPSGVIEIIAQERVAMFAIRGSTVTFDLGRNTFLSSVITAEGRHEQARPLDH